MKSREKKYASTFLDHCKTNICISNLFIKKTAQLCLANVRLECPGRLCPMARVTLICECGFQVAVSTSFLLFQLSLQIGG